MNGMADEHLGWTAEEAAEAFEHMGRVLTDAFRDCAEAIQHTTTRLPTIYEAIQAEYDRLMAEPPTAARAVLDAGTPPGTVHTDDQQ